MGHVAQAPAMTINVDLSLRGRSTEEWSLVRRINDPGVGMYSYGGGILVKPNAKSVWTPHSVVRGTVEALALLSTLPAGW